MAIFGNGKDEEDFLKVGDGNRSGDGVNPVTKAYEARKGASSALWKSVEEARERIDKLHLKMDEEMNALNREYDRLCAKVTDALKELETFESEKLGIKK